MALLKAFVCQVILLGLYKMFLEQVVEEHLVPNELTRNCLVGFVCLVCFGIQLYTEKIEDQTSHAESSKAKPRRRTPPDTAETVSDFLDARTVHMMRTLDAAMQHMNQMSTSDGYVHNVIYAAAGPEAAVIEQKFVKKPDVALDEEICMTRLSDAMNAEEKTTSESIITPVKVEKNKNEDEEQEEEEESETKSDVCEEEEEDVVTVIDATKQKLETEKTNIEATESEEEDEEETEGEEEQAVVDTKNKKIEVKPVKQISKEEDVEEESGDEQDDVEEESGDEQDEVEEDAEKVAKKS